MYDHYFVFQENNYYGIMENMINIFIKSDTKIKLPLKELI